jgi:hypothetical protein
MVSSRPGLFRRQPVDETIKDKSCDFSGLPKLPNDPGATSANGPPTDMTATRRQSKRVLYVSLVDNHSAAEAAHEPTRRCSRLTGIKQLSAPLRVTSPLRQRMAVMGNGDIVVGSKTPPRKPANVTVKDLADRTAKDRLSGAPDFTETERHCGAMSQQRGDSGTLSTPQKFVQLVGCRDPKRDSKPRSPGGG